MRKFSDFIKEEIDLRGNRGIPGDFMRNSEEEAGRNLGVRIDDESQMRTIWPQFQQLMNQSMQLMMQGPDGRPLGREQMQARLDALQNLAKDVIMDEYGEILESSTKPVELDIRLVNPNEVIRQISDLRDVPQNARPPRADDTHEEDEDQTEEDQDQQDDDCADGLLASVISGVVCMLHYSRQLEVWDLCHHHHLVTSACCSRLESFHRVEINAD